MDIEESPIFEEIKEIMASDPNPVFYRYEVEIETPEEQFPVIQMTLLDIERDYAHTYADEMVVTVRLSPADFLFRLYPHKKNFHVRIKQEPISEVSSEDVDREDVIVRRYHGVLINNRDENMESFREINTNQKDLEKAPPEEYKIQLLPPAVDQLRTKTTGGIYREMRTDHCLQALFSMAAADLDTDEETQIQGVDTVEQDDLTERDHIAIPHGTPIMELHAWLQKQYGVYRTAIGHYIQGNRWYVYPRFHTRRFEEVDDNMTIVNLPENRMPNVERTYYHEDNGRLVVMSTGEVQHVDASDQVSYNLGHGVRYADASRILDNPCQVDGNRAIASRADNIIQYTVHERENEIQFAPFSPNRITANDYNERSRYAESTGSYVRITWQNADPRRVYPGMPIRLVYMENDVLNERYGCLLGANEITAVQGGAVTRSRFQTTLELVVFVENDND